MRNALRLAIVLVVAALASCGTQVPPGDFNVTVAAKTMANPYFGMGVTICYVVNGVESATLTLTRGKTYTFSINAPGHPFYISTNPAGGTGYPGEWTTGVAGTGTEVGLLTFTPDASAPPTLYYDCGVHQYMGGTIKIQ